MCIGELACRAKWSQQEKIIRDLYILKHVKFPWYKECKNIIDRYTAWLERPKEDILLGKRPHGDLEQEEDAPARPTRNGPFAQARKNLASSTLQHRSSPSTHNELFKLNYAFCADQLFEAATNQSLLDGMYSMTIKDREQEELFQKKMKKIRARIA